MLLTFRSRLIVQPVNYAHTIVRRHQWTKASLNRMKKNDLLRLAKENHLKISGTKNDMVVQLLSHQTAKVVGSSTPTLHSIRETIRKEDVGQNQQQQQSKAAATTATTTTVKNEMLAKGGSEEETLIDMDWVNAFDTKLSHRGSRPPSLDKKANKQAAPRELRINKELEKTLQRTPASGLQEPSSPPSPSLQKPIMTATDTVLIKDIPSASTVQPSKVTESDVDGVDEMDREWVKAFEMKVESRGAKQRHQVGDTISNKPHHSSSLSAASSVLKEVVNSKPQKNILPLNTTTETDIDSSGTNNGSKNTFVSAAIGSSMLVWYFGGGDGFSQIWHFFF